MKRYLDECKSFNKSNLIWFSALYFIFGFAGLISPLENNFLQMLNELIAFSISILLGFGAHTDRLIILSMSWICIIADIVLQGFMMYLHAVNYKNEIKRSIQDLSNAIIARCIYSILIATVVFGYIFSLIFRPSQSVELPNSSRVKIQTEEYNLCKEKNINLIRARKEDNAVADIANQPRDRLKPRNFLKTSSFAYRQPGNTVCYQAPSNITNTTNNMEIPSRQNYSLLRFQNNIITKGISRSRTSTPRYYVKPNGIPMVNAAQSEDVNNKKINSNISKILDYTNV